jgi:hypothetical protein
MQLLKIDHVQLLLRVWPHVLAGARRRGQPETLQEKLDVVWWRWIA